MILRAVVLNYILTATPVGSRVLNRRFEIDLSPATIRNVLSDLEENGLLSHPHTSAGRVPTDLGYRIYVDDLMQIEGLADEDLQVIRAKLDNNSPEVDSVLEKVGRLLAEVSSLLAVILAPDISTGILDKIALIRVATGRIMVVVVVNSGLVRNILLELDSSITDDEILEASQMINQRLAGIRLTDIPHQISARLAGERTRNSIVRFFLDFPDMIFSTPPRTSEMFIEGRRNMFTQPEYRSPEQVQGIIELVEDRDIIIHLMKDRQQPGISVSIGSENEKNQLKNMSVITSTYRIGDTLGTIGIIGPTRMNYSRLMALVDYTARLVTDRAYTNKDKNS